jgi:hypothetical protein
MARAMKRRGLRIGHIVTVATTSTIIAFSLLLAFSIWMSWQDHFDINAFSALGTWVESFTQAILALVAALISYIAYKKGHSSAYIQIVADINASFNQWTEFVCSNKEVTEYLDRMQKPVLSSRAIDCCIYYYLNTLNNMYAGYLDGIIDEDNMNVVMIDFKEMCKSVSIDELTQLLRRGYSTDFSNFVESYWK